jgi:hypothetical protein
MIKCSHIHKDGTKCSGIGTEVTWGSYSYIVCHKHDNVYSIMDMLFEGQKESDRKEFVLENRKDELEIEILRLNALLEQTKGISIIRSIKSFYKDLIELKMVWKVMRKH